jgi:hypothetical protein
MSRVVSRLRLAAPAVAACVVLVACSSSSSKSTASTGTTSAAGSSAPAGSGSAGAETAGGGPAVKVCTLLPVATVASITGQNLTVAQENDSDAPQVTTCGYFTASGTGLTVAVTSLATVDIFDNALKNDGTNATLISGLGDKAYSTDYGGVTHVRARFGKVEIDAAGMVSLQAAETLIRTLQPKL